MTIFLTRNLTRIAPLAVAVLLGGCASYHPMPLGQGADLLDRVPALHVDPAKLGLPVLSAHSFDPSDGLDMTEVATLAVVNNPDLKVRRRRADLAQAQLFAAHLLPDPQISASTDKPTDNSPGLTDAYGLGLNYDLTALITHGAKTAAAKGHARQVDLALLWQEWQVAQRARELYVQVQTQAHKRDLLQKAQHLYAQRYARSHAALSAGNLTLDVAGTDLTALMDANSRLGQTKQALDRSRHALKALLGLAPDTHLPLSGLDQPPGPVALPGGGMKAAIKTLARRRPDLLALRAGYESQEARVRQAILAQFPSISVGFTRARDTSDVHTTGFGITLNLPIFDGNRGAIAVQRATRAALHQDYQARVDAAYGQLDQLRSQGGLLRAQLARTRSRLPALQAMVHRAAKAYRARDIGALTYLNMQTTLLNKQLEVADLRQSLWKNRIALDTLLTWPQRQGPEQRGHGSSKPRDQERAQ